MLFLCMPLHWLFEVIRMKFNVCITTYDEFQMEGKSKEEVELRILEGMSAKEQGLSDIEVQEVEE